MSKEQIETQEADTEADTAVETKEDKVKAVVKEIIGYFIFAAVVAAILFFVLGIAVVSGSSMNETYHTGDKLLYFKLGSVQKGDVVICDSDIEKILVKRVIATAGDTLDIDFETGDVILNGEVLSEPYIAEATHLNENPAFEYPITVPDGCYFVMGDNRNHSRDSRDISVGYITDEQIRGKVICRLAEGLMY
jgi:signal peptidase I